MSKRRYKQDWARIDSERRQFHYQVRLSPELSKKVDSYRRKHHINSRNETLRQIIQSYFEFDNG